MQGRWERKTAVLLTRANRMKQLIGTMQCLVQHDSYLKCKQLYPWQDMNYHTIQHIFPPTKCVSMKPENRKHILTPWVNPPKDMEHPSLCSFFMEPFPTADVHLQKAILWQTPQEIAWGRKLFCLVISCPFSIGFPGTCLSFNLTSCKKKISSSIHSIVTFQQYITCVPRVP